MTSISLLTIEGIIPTPGFNPGFDRGLNYNCRVEVLSPQVLPPQIFKVNKTYELGDSLQIKENFEEFAPSEDPYFWKNRVIIEMMASENIFSIAFIPRSFIGCQVLFLQKTDQLHEITGFVAPYLSAEDQNELEAVSFLPDYRELDDDEESINHSIEGLGYCAADLKPILKYFLQDYGSVFLAVTCLGDYGKVVSRGWLKA